jgi:hypothetical protein
MNLLILLAALLPWASSTADVLFRFFAAVGLLSLEMQIVTLSGVGSLHVLPPVNVVLAAGLAMWQSARRPISFEWTASLWRVAPPPAILALGAVVLILSLLLPLQAADPYHLDRMAQIERLGTLEYDPAATPKVNIVGWVYELILADVHAVPVVGEALLRAHGVFGLLLYLTALATAREWLGRGTSRWPWMVVLVVPVVFHQLVLIKNDLFIGVAGFTALLWMVARSPQASWRETAQAGSLAGFIVGCKFSNVPLAVLFAAGVLLSRRDDRWRALAAVALGGAIGAVAGGLFFTFLENARWYGDPLASGPLAELGNVNPGPTQAAESVLRFGISLVDLGVLTTRWWPGRGGWGSTFGLPFIWAAAVLLVLARRDRNARWALIAAGAHFVVFGATFPDADVAQRLVLASGLLVIVTAVAGVDGDDTLARPARIALIPVLLLSTTQILRSAMLYLNR